MGRPVAAIQIEQEGHPVTEDLITGLIETRVGRPLSMADVRESIDHLDGLGRFDDVQVTAQASGAGVAIRFVLVPAHPVAQVLFHGGLGLAEEELRQVLAERHGPLPPVSRAEEVVQTLRGLYQDHGYLRASVSYRLEIHHDPDRSTLVFAIDAGVRAVVATVRVEGLPDAPERDAFLDRVGLKAGRPYDTRALRAALDNYESDLRGRGYLQARADQSTEYTPSGEAIITIAIERGSHVVVTFAGDPLPTSVTDQLVPIRQEASVDEDLLETGSLAIEDYLRARGYRDATADHTRAEGDGALVITFTVARGPRYVVDAVDPRGNREMTGDQIRLALKTRPGDPFVQSIIDAGVGAIRAAYRSRGFTRVSVDDLASVLPSAAGGGDRRVQVVVDILEGVRTLVADVEIGGNAALPESELRALVATAPGRPYSDTLIAGDRDRLQTVYLDRGYETAVVDQRTLLTDNDAQAHVRFVINEGPQIMVDHVIIVGNQRTRTATIERELLLRPGQPLGAATLIESQQRLIALGLFRRVTIAGRGHGSEARRDVVVQVEEAPPMTIDYGGGLEGGRRLRPTAEGGAAEERFEVAPRAFFQVGRRNLGGKNRSIDLFTRVSLRSRDVVISSDGTRLVSPSDSSYGFNEYRVVTTYREPKVFDTRADVLIIGTLDQSIRSSFSFRTHEVDGRASTRLSPKYTLTGTYIFRAVELFDERFTDAEKPLIDRLFPQVRLSMFAATVVRDTRTDVLDPERGTFVAFEHDVAARAYGSEVGLVKSYLQAFAFRRLPARRRVVLGLAAKVGAARGFARSVPLVDQSGKAIRGADGLPQFDVVEDLPASERFFAGGDTTVRGFSLDRLGDRSTITPTGFPTGGNGLVVLNAELRISMFGPFQGVGFVDAGNVFPKARDLNVFKLRPAAGVGVRYRSPVGPIRVDWGFNLDRQELVPGTLERGNVLHISLGQAF